MSYDERLAERVQGVLSARSDVLARRMMGALAFMVGDRMCCCVSGADILVRVGANAMDWALAQPHVRPMEIGGRRMGGFVRIAAPAYPDDAALASWVRRGVDVALALPAKRRAPPRYHGKSAKAPRP